MHEITWPPVVVPLAAAVFAVLAWRLRRRGALTAPRLVVAALACAYGAGVAANTLLPVHLGGDGYDPPLRVFLNITPLANTELADMAKNLVLFLPLGVLLPLAARAGSALRALLSGFLICLAMEVLQFAGAAGWHSGHVADINDLLADMAGVLLGYLLFRGVLLLPGARRLARAWGRPDLAGPEPAGRHQPAPRQAGRPTGGSGPPR